MLRFSQPKHYVWFTLGALKRGTAMQKCGHRHLLGLCRACPKHLCDCKGTTFFWDMQIFLCFSQKIVLRTHISAHFQVYLLLSRCKGTIFFEIRKSIEHFCAILLRIFVIMCCVFLRYSIRRFRTLSDPPQEQDLYHHGTGSEANPHIRD